MSSKSTSVSPEEGCVWMTALLVLPCFCPYQDVKMLAFSENFHVHDTDEGETVTKNM